MSKPIWYRVEVQIGAESYFFTGSSQFDEPELLRKLSSGDFFVLEDLVYIDEDGTVRPWTEWDPECHPRICLNGKFVLSVMPLVGDPRRRMTSEDNILRMPSRPGQFPPDER